MRLSEKIDFLRWNWINMIIIMLKHGKGVNLAIRAYKGGIW